MDRIQVDILGLSTSPSSGGAYALILKELNGARRLPIIIGAFEAQSIALEMEGIKPPRPLTHDLMKSIIDTLGGALNDVTINDLRDGTFYAQLSMEDSTEIDSRPSDAIALAVRFGVPIYVADKVMDEAGFVPENEETEGSAPPPSDEKTKSAGTAVSKLDELQKELVDAIAREDYERAARLRDEINKLQSKNT